ncbi:hypothetical protein WJX79_009165 [Trebouxia sp. C0005]
MHGVQFEDIDVKSAGRDPCLLTDEWLHTKPLTDGANFLVCKRGEAEVYALQLDITPSSTLIEAKLPNDYTLVDAVLELFDNGLEACYHPELEAGKHKAILLTYGKALDTDKLALEIFDGGIGMAGMDSSSGGIAAWAALGCSVRKRKSKQDDPPPFLTAQLGRYGVGAMAGTFRIGMTVKVSSRMQGQALVWDLWYDVTRGADGEPKLLRKTRGRARSRMTAREVALCRQAGWNPETCSFTCTLVTNMKEDLDIEALKQYVRVVYHPFLSADYTVARGQPLAIVFMPSFAEGAHGVNLGEMDDDVISKRNMQGKGPFAHEFRVEVCDKKTGRVEASCRGNVNAFYLPCSKGEEMLQHILGQGQEEGADLPHFNVRFAVKTDKTALKPGDMQDAQSMLTLGIVNLGRSKAMMQEAAWKKSSKALKIAYLDKDGRFVKFVDEKRFHSSYLEWVQKQHNMFDDECVPQDQGVIVLNFSGVKDSGQAMKSDETRDKMQLMAHPMATFHKELKLESGGVKAVWKTGEKVKLKPSGKGSSARKPAYGTLEYFYISGIADVNSNKTYYAVVKPRDPASTSSTLDQEASSFRLGRLCIVTLAVGKHISKVGTLEWRKLEQAEKDAMPARLEFVRGACKPASFVDNTWKPTGYKVTEISWGVVQNNGQPYMQPGIKTELTLEHSEGEEFVHEQDRRKSGLETVRQKHPAYKVAELGYMPACSTFGHDFEMDYPGTYTITIRAVEEQYAHWQPLVKTVNIQPSTEVAGIHACFHAGPCAEDCEVDRCRSKHVGGRSKHAHTMSRMNFTHAVIAPVGLALRSCTGQDVQHVYVWIHDTTGIQIDFSERVELDFEILNAETGLPIGGMEAHAVATQLDDGYMKVSGLSVHGKFHQHGVPGSVNAVIKIALGHSEDFDILDSYQGSLGMIPVRLVAGPPARLCPDLSNITVDEGAIKLCPQGEEVYTAAEALHPGQDITDLQLFWLDKHGNLCGHHPSLSKFCRDSSPDMRVQFHNFGHAKKKKGVWQLNAEGALDLDPLNIKVSAYYNCSASITIQLADGEGHLSKLHFKTAVRKLQLYQVVDGKREIPLKQTAGSELHGLKVELTDEKAEVVDENTLSILLRYDGDKRVQLKHGRCDLPSFQLSKQQITCSLVVELENHGSVSANLKVQLKLGEAVAVQSHEEVIQCSMGQEVALPLTLLDDHKNIVPLPPLAKGTLRLVASPPEAFLPTWKLSTDRKRFLIKLRGQAGRIKIALADNERNPLLHIPPEAMGESHLLHLTERLPVTTWTLDVAHGEPRQLLLECDQVTMVQHSSSRPLPFKLVDEWANTCTTLPSWTLTPLASLLQSGTDHFSKVSAPVGEYDITFESCHAGKTLATLEPLRVTIVKSALPGSVKWMLPEEKEHQAGHLPDITLSWPPANQAGDLMHLTLGKVLVYVTAENGQRCDQQPKVSLEWVDGQPNCRPIVADLPQPVMLETDRTQIHCFLFDGVPVPRSFTHPGSYLLRAVCKIPGSRPAKQIAHVRTVVVPTGRPAWLCFIQSHMAKSTVKTGQGLAAAPNAYALATVSEGVAVFKDIIVTGNMYGRAGLLVTAEVQHLHDATSSWQVDNDKYSLPEVHVVDPNLDAKLAEQLEAANRGLRHAQKRFADLVEQVHKASKDGEELRSAIQLNQAKQQDLHLQWDDEGHHGYGSHPPGAEAEEARQEDAALWHSLTAGNLHPHDWEYTNPSMLNKPNSSLQALVRAQQEGKAGYQQGQEVLGPLITLAKVEDPVLAHALGCHLRGSVAIPICHSQQGIETLQGKQAGTSGLKALQQEFGLPDNCTMPGGIALDSKPVLAAADRCQSSCDGAPEGPQGWLQLPFPAGECVGANGLLGHAINMLHFDSHLVHLRGSIFWMKFGQLLVYDTDDSLQAAVPRLGTSNHPVPPLLSLQGGCHRTNGEQNLDDMPLQQRTASFAVLAGAYMQQLADDQGHSMWPPYANLMARRQADRLAAECQADGQKLRQDLTSCTAKLNDLEVEKNSAQAELRSAQASRGPESMSHEASTSGHETSNHRARAGRKRSTVPQRAGTQTHLHSIGSGQKTGDSEISVSEGRSSKRIRTNCDES